MSRHDDALRAEELDRFLEERAEPTALLTADLATAQALSQSAEQMVPDAAFAARLEQRLQTMPLPTDASPARTGEPTWWQRLFPSVGRLAWVGVLAFLIVAFALSVRGLLEDNAPLDIPDPRREEAVPSDATPVATLVPPLSVTRGDTTISLYRAIAWEDRTEVTFDIVTPLLPRDREKMWRYSSHFHPDDIVLEGFERDEIILTSGSRHIPGRLGLTLEMPPPASEGASVVVELPTLTIMQDLDEPRAEYTEREGPWRFEFVPDSPEALEPFNEVELKARGSNEALTLVVERLERSALETVITYRPETPHPQRVWPLDAEAQLILGDERYDGRPVASMIGGGDVVEEEGYQISFPPLPDEVRELTFEFGPYWVSQEQPAEVTLELDALVGEGQVVTVEGHELRFWLESSELATRTPSWIGKLYYSPVDQDTIPFTFSGPDTPLSLTDQLGNSYQTVYGAGEYDAEQGHLIQQQHLLIVEELDENATTLTLRSELTGRIVDRIQIPVTLPEAQSTDTDPTATSDAAVSDPLPPATPVPSQPTQLYLGDAELIAEGESLVVDGWSPDGSHLLYREITEADRQLNPQFPPSDFYVYPCDRIKSLGDHRQSRPHFWLDENQLVYVTDRGAMFSWPACSDEQASFTELFPEIPLEILAFSPDRSRFLYRGQDDYWIFHLAERYYEQRVEGLLEEETVTLQEPSNEFPGLRLQDVATWSPDGSQVAIAIASSGDTVIVDGATGTLIYRVDGVALGEDKAGPEEPIWLSNQALVIPTLVVDSVPLLVSEQDGEWSETPLHEQLVEGTSLADEDVAVWQAFSARDEVNQRSHVILVGLNEGGQVLPYPLLYHAENDMVEELWIDTQEGLPGFVEATFSESGRYLLMRGEWPIDDVGGEVWGRPLDPVGTPPTQLDVGSGEFHLSPYGRRTAALTETGLIVIDNRTAATTHQLDTVVTAAWWTPDGEGLVVRETIFAESSFERLLLLPLTEGETSAEQATLAVEPTVTADFPAFEGSYSCNTDLNLSWMMPKDWFVYGFQIQNYEMLVSPRFVPTNEHVRIHVFSIDKDGRSLEEVVEEQRVSVTQGPPLLTLTPSEPVTIAGMQGYSFTGATDDDPSAGLRLITLDAGSDRVITIEIRPLFTDHMDEALAILETIEPGPCARADTTYVECPPGASGDGACLPDVSDLVWQPLPDDSASGDYLADFLYPIVSVEETNLSRTVAVTVQKDERRDRFATALIDGANSLWIGNDIFNQRYPPIFSPFSVRGLLWADNAGALFLHDGTRRQLAAPGPVYAPRGAGNEMAFAVHNGELWRGNIETGAWEAVSVEGQAGASGMSNFFGVANDESYALSVQPDGMWRVPATMGAPAVPLPAPAVTTVSTEEPVPPPRQLGQTGYWLVSTFTAGEGGQSEPHGRGFIVDAATGRTLSAADFGLPSDAEALTYSASPYGNWIAIAYTSSSAGGPMLYIAPSDDLAGGATFAGRMLAGWDENLRNVILREEETGALVTVALDFDPGVFRAETRLTDAGQLLAVGQDYIVTTSTESSSDLLLFDFYGGGSPAEKPLQLPSDVVTIDSASIVTLAGETLYLGVTFDDGRHGLVRWELE